MLRAQGLMKKLAFKERNFRRLRMTEKGVEKCTNVVNRHYGGDSSCEGEEQPSDRNKHQGIIMCRVVVFITSVGNTLVPKY